MHEAATGDQAGVADVGAERATPTPADVDQVVMARFDGLPATRRGQRAMDLVLAVPAALVTLPLLVACAVLSAISFRAWPIFTQPRMGRDGQEISFWKIRSLPPTAPSAADKYSIAEVRNTRVGSLLRKTKFDELPQLWLVVRGDMSLVGPRPEMPSLAATFDQGFVELRTTVRPGITGLWQVSMGASGLIGETPEYDLWYLANRSWRLDLWIMWRTVGLILGWGAIELDDVPRWCRR